MIKDLIENALTRPALRQTPDAQAAGEAETSGLLRRAMRAVAEPVPNSSPVQRARRQWAGSRVSGGEHAGTRQPSIGSKTRPVGHLAGDALDRAFQARMEETAAARGRHPTGYGVGGYFAGDAAGASQGASAVNMPQSLGSLRSGMLARLSRYDWPTG